VVQELPISAKRRRGSSHRHIDSRIELPQPGKDDAPDVVSSHREIVVGGVVQEWKIGESCDLPGLGASDLENRPVDVWRTVIWDSSQPVRPGAPDQIDKHRLDRVVAGVSGEHLAVDAGQPAIADLSSLRLRRRTGRHLHGDGLQWHAETVRDRARRVGEHVGGLEAVMHVGGRDLGRRLDRQEGEGSRIGAAAERNGHRPRRQASSGEGRLGQLSQATRCSHDEGSSISARSGRLLAPR